MDIPPMRLIKLLGPRIPEILKTILLSKLSLSANSDKQDTRTEVVVLIIRSLLTGASRSLKVIQDGSVKDLTIKGKMWIAKTTIPAPETDLRDLVLRGIKELGDGSEQFTLPDISEITGEWTGYRECQKDAPRMQTSEREQYEHLMKETTSDSTVLYFHGGAYIMMDPSSHRGTTSGLAKKTGGRCFSVRYRLAPQHPFPAQLIDALVAYLYLQAPPEGAFHSPVPASKIVFAGDSAGGHLSCSLLLLLITLRKAGVNSVRFHGKEVPIEIPAGMAVNSPWTDISRSLPTVSRNARFDYLEPPSATGLPGENLPPDEIWPAKPPRAEMFCTASVLTHPLTSPVMASPEMWKGAPPVFICCGNEGLEDDATIIARRLYQAGGSVDFVGYEGMPHCFAMIFPSTASGKDCFGRWAQFISDAVQGRVGKRDTARWAKAFSNPITFNEINMATMGIPDEDVNSAIHHSKSIAMEREQEARKKWEQDARARL